MRCSSLIAASFLSGAATAHSGCQTSCKAFPGTASWPSSREWSRLNKTLDGQLIAPLAPGRVCHEGQPDFDKEQCATVQKEWSFYGFHADDPVSVMWDNWSNYTCLPDPKAPCSAKGYPSYVVNATTAEHVKAGIDFGEHAHREITITHPMRPVLTGVLSPQEKCQAGG